MCKRAPKVLTKKRPVSVMQEMGQWISFKLEEMWAASQITDARGLNLSSYFKILLNYEFHFNYLNTQQLLSATRDLPIKTRRSLLM